ncbi:MAG: putative peptidoglycan D,D-transpeptidase PenA [candidate division WS2 bacterium]|uniref:Peptidoglycan D,D-transpeptidase PenA n=1 Tax=Psychracetigena formicireducens TaxID=2986056 RepID=A0A9E2BIN9_PSYF1|nr:putative peptidoglycan D,D-transpeptidase PenA [Candidatus Psychracetigena formicireducens]MBT9144850.1 putative peptidoglycan D,D-transpeptidase PenA [Candidatus Psychracetigena formicireducens]
MNLETPRKAILVLGLILGLCLLTFVAFTFSLQVFSTTESNPFSMSLSKVYSRRGNIYDRNGVLLAFSVPSNSILVHPSLFRGDENMIYTLSRVGGITVNELKTRLERGRNFYLRRQLTEIPDEVKGVIGVSILEDSKRLYPHRKSASHILGFVDVDGWGRGGIEGYQNEILKGRDGLAFITIDAAGRGIPTYPQGSIMPVQGSDILLTIDIHVQNMVEKALARGIDKYKALSGSAVVMDINTGEIWALANYPDFDPNNFRQSTGEQRRNRALSFNYEAGSVLKTVSLAIALEEEVVSLNSEFPAPASLRLRGGVVNNFRNRAYNVQNLKEALKTSTNTVFAQLALKIGRENFNKYYHTLFGVGRSFEVGMPGVEVGIYVDPESEMHLANIGFGQGIALTPLQVTSIYATLGNGGYFLKPGFIRAIRDSQGQLRYEHRPRILRTVFRKQTSDLIIEALDGSITSQTNRLAQVEGYSLGGKTGTAQKIIDGKYSDEKIITTFAGFVTLKNPRFLIVVMFDEPNAPASSTAVPVFGEIARGLIEYLQLSGEGK